MKKILTNKSIKGDFIGYEYKDITINRDVESLYIDGYENFGWQLEGEIAPVVGVNSIKMKFKRDRKIKNKAELTRLQRQFESSVKEILNMEKSKTTNATIIACVIGLIGTAFLAGATFSYLGGLILLCIVLAIPGFLGWIIPYFAYNFSYAKKSDKLSPMIENKYDEAYEVCEKANRLL